MEFAKASFERAQPRTCRLNHNLALVSPLDGAFPSIDGPHRGKNVDARGKSLFDQLRREFFDVPFNRKGGEDNDEISHAASPESASSPDLESTERLVQVGQQVFDILDADRDANQSVGDAEHVAPFLGHRCVRHDRRMRD